jgi:hypothetical protein
MLYPSHLIKAVVILVALACHANPSSAQVRPQDWHNIPLDEVLHLDFKGRRFDVPAAYLQPWPTRKYFKPGALTKVGDLAFAFWMPTRGYLTFNRLSTPSFHPKHDPAYANGYVVGVDFVKFDVSRIPGELTPLTQIQNKISLDPDAFRYAKEHGLVRYWRENRPNLFVSYRHTEDTQPQINLRCRSLPEDRALPNPSCDGFVYFEDDDIQFHVAFSTVDLAHWRETVTAARDLIQQWEVKGSSKQ